MLWLQWSLLWLFIIHNTTATYSSNIDTLLRKGVEEMDLQGQEDYIVLVGGTGTGKSTLSKFIRKDESMTVKLNRQFDYILVDNEVQIGSEKSHTSKTFFPNVDKDPESGLLLIDSAGFADTRSEEFDLVASFLNKKILDSAKRMKIIIVENYGNLQLNNYRSGFSAILKHLNNLIGSNIDSFQGAIGLVATKIMDPYKSDEILIKAIKVFVGDVREYLFEEFHQVNDTGKKEDLQQRIKITNFLLEGDNFGLFRRPHELGSPWESLPLKLNYNMNRKLLFQKLNFSSPFKGEFSISVAPTTINYVNENLLLGNAQTLTKLFEKFGTEIQKTFDSKTNVQPYEKNLDFVIGYCEKNIRQLNNAEHLDDFEYFVQSMMISQELWNDIKFEISKMHFFLKVVGKTAQDSKSKVVNMFGARMILFLHFTESRNFHEFSKNFIADFDTYAVRAMNTDRKLKFTNITEGNFDLWKTSLGTFGFSDLSSLSASSFKADVTKIAKLRNLVLNYFSGRSRTDKFVAGSATIIDDYLVLSHIADKVQGKDYQEVTLIATKKLYIDIDVEILNAHLLIVSPLIEAVGAVRKIYMKGENGRPHERMKVAKTSHGLKGRNGYSSGKLILVSLDIVNPQLLVLHSSGGAGTSGQDGGDGLTPSIPSISACSGLDGRWSDIRRKLLNCGLDYYYITFPIGSDEAHIKVTNFARGNPTNGGDGGDSGISAEAGTHSFVIKNTNVVRSIKKSRSNGLISNAGKGGAAGKSVESYFYRKYKCTSHEVRSSSMLQLRFDHVNLKCSTVETGFSPTKTPSARAGNHGKQISSRLIYKNEPKNGVFHAIIEYCNYAIKTSRLLAEEPHALQFFEYFVTNNEILRLLRIENYQLFLKNLDSYLQESSNFANVESVYFAMYRSFRGFMQRCDHCDNFQLKAVNLLFMSRLNYLQTFSIGTQVIHLRSAAVKLQNKLSVIERSFEEIANFKNVDSEIQKARKQVDHAQDIIENSHQQRISEIKIEIDEKLSQLLSITKNFQVEYASNLKKLETHKKSVEKAMIAKAVFGSLEIFGQVAGLFFPPASMIGKTVNAIGSALTQPSELDLAANSAKRPKGLDNALSVIAKYKEKRVRNEHFRHVEQIKALKDVIAAEATVGKIILNDEHRKSVLEIVKVNTSSTSQNIKLVFNNLPHIFNSVGIELHSRIAKSEKENSAHESVKKLKIIKNTMEVAQRLSSVPGAIIDVVMAHSNDQSKLGQIKATIESNVVALQDMARYEKTLNDEFIPILKEMLETFQNLQIGLMDINSVMLQFRKMDVKKLARRFMATINQFTKGFFDEDDGMSNIFVQLEEYMSLLIDAYDKLNELDYRVQLKEFLSRIHGGDCSRSRNPHECTKNQELANEIKANEVFRNFLFIFTAYQQSLFPFGGTKMGIIHSLIFEFNKTPHISMQGKAKLIQNAIKLIVDDLNEIQENISNEREKDIVLAEFNSKYTSSSPFFTWPNSKFSTQIKQLLRGEQVILTASVQNPTVKNAVKFKTLLLNITSPDPMVSRVVHEHLKHFQIKMVHMGESHYKCRSTYYVIGSEPLDMRICYEKTDVGGSVCRNTVFEKLSYGEVPLSPYTVWSFQLLHQSNSDKEQLLGTLQTFANSVDLELVGTGFFVEDNAPICDTYLGQFYSIYQP